MLSLKGVVVTWEEGIRQAGCSRTKGKCEETRMEHRKKNEGPLPESQANVAAVGPCREEVFWITK